MLMSKSPVRIAQGIGEGPLPYWQYVVSYYQRKYIGMKSKSRQTNKPDDNIPTFLAKTYDMLERPENEKMISWTPDGKAFRVKNVADFTNKILPKYFKHNNYASFIRQLNMYGFHKVKSDPPYQTFKQDKFERDNRAALAEIKRKAHESKDQIPQQQESSDHNCEMGNQVLAPLMKIQSMKKKQDQLEKVVDILVEQNKQILQDNRHLWNKMKKTIDKEEKRLESVILLLLLNGKGITDKPNNEICQEQQSDDDNTLTVPKNALLPFDDANSKKLALEAILNQLQKRKSKSKKKFEDELFLHNQGEHLKIINNLVSRLNNVKAQDQGHFKPDPLQIQNEDSKSNAPPAMLKPVPENQPINHQIGMNLQHHDAPHSPFMSSSPFIRRMSSDFVGDGDEAINRFLLNRSDDEFHLSKDHDRHSQVQPHFEHPECSADHMQLQSNHVDPPSNLLTQLSLDSGSKKNSLFMPEQHSPAGTEVKSKNKESK